MQHPGSLTTIALFLTAATALAQLPLPGAPDWTSNDNDYSTGGSFADVDGNGFLDLLTSNGNDMANNRNGIYLNSGGTLETVASWRSRDQGMFGHCYSGDIDNDGLPDLAVAYLGPDTTRSKLVARVYRNTGAGLDSVPCWHASDRHSSFDCCLGDFDLDGDLDLAVSAGNAYSGETDSARIYRNNGGVLDTLPYWTAHEGVASDAIRCGDIDNDGDLDLLVGHRRKVTMYRNDAGTLDPDPAWVARAGVGWVLRLALGDYDNDGWLDLAVASNGQIGDPNSIRVYHNVAGTLDTLASYTMLATDEFSSCVAWGDVDGDGWLELACGGWWEDVVVFDNEAGTLQTVPGWNWGPANPSDLVCEALLWGDVGSQHLAPAVDSLDGDGNRRLFRFSRTPVQHLDSVKVEGALVLPTGYCWDALGGWLSFVDPPARGSDNIELHYRLSTAPDLAVTNWVGRAGNHLFLNTTDTSGIAQGPETVRTRLRALPNPSWSMVALELAEPLGRVPVLAIYREDGSLVRRLEPSGNGPAGRWLWDGLDDSGRPTGSGVYIVRLPNGSDLKLVRMLRH